MLEKLAKDIENNWHYPTRLSKKQELPSPEFANILALIEAAFFGSLKREERQPIRFSLALIAPDAAQHRVLLTFAEPLELSVRVISKVASAFDVRTTALAVDPTTREIWGVIRSTKGTRPACLIVTVASAGSLIVASGNRLLGYFYPDSDGDFELSAPSPFAHGAMGGFIHLPELTTRANGTIPKSRYRWVVQELLSEASELSHGGTIILVPRSMESEVRKLYDETYPLSKGIDASAALKNFLETGGGPSLPESLEQIVRLASVDGALILTRDFQVLAFGAKLKQGTPPDKVVIGPDGSEIAGLASWACRPFDTTVVGTRHNSAFTFIANCPEAIAFVISEDGPIRGVAGFHERAVGFRDKGITERTVLVWRDVRDPEYQLMDPSFF